MFYIGCIQDFSKYFIDAVNMLLNIVIQNRIIQKLKWNEFIKIQIIHIVCSVRLGQIIIRFEQTKNDLGFTIKLSLLYFRFDHGSF